MRITPQMTAEGLDANLYIGSQRPVPALVSDENRLTETEANCAGPPDGYDENSLRASMTFCITVRQDNRPSCSIITKKTATVSECQLPQTNSENSVEQHISAQNII